MARFNLFGLKPINKYPSVALDAILGPRKQESVNEKDNVNLSSKAINLPYENFMNLSLKELADITGENNIYIAREGRGIIGEAYLLCKFDSNSSKTVKEKLEANLSNTNGIRSMAIISRKNEQETLIGIYSNKENILPGNLESKKLSNYIKPHFANNIKNIQGMTTEYNSKIPITMFNSNYSMLNQKPK